MASFKKQLPVSAFLKSDDPKEEKKTRGEHKKEKDLEEERKLGIAPAMVDVETGRDINPHIPLFISQTPWYVPTDGPTLKHQRPHAERQKVEASLDDWYQRGTVSTASIKYRKGACENCGGMGHKQKDCLERPRKRNAKLSGNDIKSDDIVQPKLVLGFDAKRDRWNGYDPSTHQDVIDEFEHLEEARKLAKAEKIKAGIVEPEPEGEVPEDEDKYAEDADMPGNSVDMDSRTRITVRNLRIREDTAKYLYNLSENAPYYDPKSRSMRENPFQGVAGKEKEAAKFMGENFVRYSGDVVEANEAQVFAWAARCQGIDVHALAEPTKLEALKRQYEKEKSTVKEDTKKQLVEKYGGAEHLEAPPKELLLAQSERYVEYSRKGKLLKGEERPLAKSSYEEDIYPGNHTSVWGSYWDAGNWGYKCCHQTLKQAYCVGKKNKGESIQKEEIENVKEEEENTKPSGSQDKATPSLINKEEIKLESKNSDSKNSENSGSSSNESETDSEKERELEEEKKRREQAQKRREKKRDKRRRKKDKKSKEGDSKRKRRHSSSGSSSDEYSSSDDKEKTKELKRAIREAKEEKKRAKTELEQGDRGRSYNTSYEVKNPSEAQIEAYKITTIHSSDPMADYIRNKER